MKTLDRVINIIAVHFGMPDGEVEASNAIVYDLGADSLDAIEIVMAIEEEFDIEVPEQDLIARYEVFTVQDAVNMVDNLKIR